jgi:asparagine synthetase B (glutamine-hydrolysing)
LVAATTLLDKTGKLGISFNQEIFNYLERRGELAAKGVGLTRSDTEATLQPYKTG